MIGSTNPPAIHKKRACIEFLLERIARDISKEEAEGSAFEQRGPHPNGSFCYAHHTPVNL